MEGVFTPKDLRESVTAEDIYKCLAALEIKSRVEEVLYDLPRDKE